MSLANGAQQVAITNFNTELISNPPKPPLQQQTPEHHKTIKLKNLIYFQ
jgi:hypothetical protein